MMRRLEVVSAADERIEVPTGELQARQEPQRAVRGEVAGALGRAQARGGGAVDRRDRPGEPDRRERIAGCAAQLDAEPVAVPSHRPGCVHGALSPVGRIDRSEEHTSELQSPCNLVCRLLLEKKKKKNCEQKRATKVYNYCTQNTRNSH